MKRIIPIFLIIVIISCIALSFAVSALSSGRYEYYSNTVPYIAEGTEFYFGNVNVSCNGSFNAKSCTPFYVSYLGRSNNILYTYIVLCNTVKCTYNSSSQQYLLEFYNSSLSKSSYSIYFFFDNQFNLINMNTPYSTGYYYNGISGTLMDSGTYPIRGFTISDNVNITDSKYSLSITIIPDDYTITFNSNGGSIIEPITDIEPGSTVNLTTTIGGITQYSPAFIPEREGYIFDYWYQLDYPLTPVHSITVNEDITLIAKWSNDSSLAYISFGDGFYSDINHSAALTGGYYEIGSYIDFYTYYSGSQIYRGKVAFTDLNDDVTYYQGPSGSYRYHVQITESGSFSLVLLDYCTTYVSLYPDVEGTYVSHIQYAIQDGEWHNYTFDDALTIQPGYQLHFRFYLTAPYVITEGVYYYSLIDYENVFIRSDVKTNNDWQTFWTEVYLDVTINHSGTLYLYVKSISDYDITSRDIVGIYDESTGEFSWAVSEVSLLDTNWEDVASNVPQNLAYMFDGIYSLSGLAIIVPLCMMVAFGLWFIRRS